MTDTPLHIKFQNQQNPKSSFDFLKLKDLYTKEDLDHSPFELHVVEFYAIVFFETNGGKHTIDFENYSCRKGSLLTIRKNQIHKFHKRDQVDGVLLLFTDDFLVSYLEKLESIKTLQLFNEILSAPKIQLNKSDFTEVKSILNRIQKEYFKVNDRYSTSIIRSELHILITNLFRIKSKKDIAITPRRYLQEFQDFQHLVESKVVEFKKVKDYAKMMGISTKTLNTITREIVNKPAKDFIDEICIKQIKRLLINTEWSIKEIAYATGFEETTNFYKYFKRHLQHTPEQWRAEYDV